MRKAGRAALVSLIVLSAAALVAGQADVGFEEAKNGNHPIECPTPIFLYADFYQAMACKGEGCLDIACDVVRLESYTAFAYGPPEGGVTLPVLRNVTVLGADHVIWSTGREDDENPEKAVRVHEGITLSLKNITVETDPLVNSKNFLLPKVFRLVGSNSRLNLENVTYLTSKSIMEDVLNFAEGNLPRSTFRETVVPSGEDAIVISEYTSDVVTVKDLTISHWTFAEHNRDEDGRGGQGIVNSIGMVNAMKTWNGLFTDHLEIQEDISLEKSDFRDELGEQEQAMIGRRFAVLGRRATHGPFEKVPLLDLGLVSKALKVKNGVQVEFRDLELLNLALGPLEMHYGFLMWFLDFERNSNSTTVTIGNSTMVVSCRELEHFEYAVALLNDPLQTLLPQLPFLKLNSKDWTIDSASNGIIRVQRGLAFGLELQDVNLTCKPSHGTPMVVDFQLMSPLATTASDPVPSPPPREPSATSPAPDNSLGTSSTLFKVGLGVLVPCIAVLAALLVWKCRSNRHIRSGAGKKARAEAGAKLKQYDMEAGKDPTDSLRDKNMKHSMSDSFEQDKLDQLPALSHDGMGLGTDFKLTPADVGGSQAAEFIPDILKVSNDIDDKQLVVKELLGQGQNGSVHKGVWRELEVAVKTIVFRGEGDKDFHQQAIREVAITSGLAHPNVVCTYSYDIKRLQPGSLEARVAGLKNKSGVNILDSYVDWKLFIIQEFCERGTLQTALRDKEFTDRRTDTPDLKALLEIATGIAKGMHHIHSKNILHGNLKPSNVLLKTALDTHTRMLAKIADFGLSLKMNSEQTHVSNVQQGEPFYMAREVMEEGSASKAADVYAFGVVLWEMYTSQLAPKGEPTEEMFSEFPRLPWQCPAMYGVLAVACMHPVPSGRPTFSDCLSFLQSLWHQQRMGTLTAPPPAPSAVLREKFRDCKDIVGGCPKVSCGGMDSHQPMSGRVPLTQIDPEFDRAMDKRRTYFQKSLAKMPPVFRNIEYEAVYWPEMDRSHSPRWMPSD
eukprot:evm.model.scf_1330.3 EVM.evm.TU.scf_1330.3   scf_1330:17054-27691(+)